MGGREHLARHARLGSRRVAPRLLDRRHLHLRLDGRVRAGEVFGRDLGCGLLLGRLLDGPGLVGGLAELLLQETKHETLGSEGTFCVDARGPASMGAHRRSR